ncbi:MULTISPECIES: hypothetical protein [Achromobacter]|uniref:Uncharacterized protein n=1 Tax=Achromobacter spanius TaxID=217203 RepID=A0AA42LVT5_9BURK|nr:hypothetical protein [Achromobacter spanius]MDH0740353.1 hypothetical protein [Achromobacter spanius]
MKGYLDVATAAIAMVCPALAGPLAVGSATAGVLYENAIRQRKAVADEIAMRELADANTYDALMADPDTFVSRAARYYQAAIIGSAHANLRILARMIVCGGERAMPADEFLYLAQTIESLRHDELLVLASFSRARRRRDQDNALDAKQDLYSAVETDLAGIFDTSELDGLVHALLRTGFLTTRSGWGGSQWNVTSLLLRLEATTQFSLIVQDDVQPRKN